MASMSAKHARRYRRIGQFAAAALAVSAASLWALDVPALSRRLPPAPVVAPAPSPAMPPLTPPRESLDRDAIAAMADRLEIGSNVKKPEPVPVETVTKVEAPPPPAGAEWSYLGEIREPGRNFALIAIEGQQRILAEGRTYGGTKLVSISPHEIVLQNDHGSQHLSLAQRSEASPRVAWVRNMPTNGAPTPAPALAANVATAIAKQQQERMIEDARIRQGYRTFREREMDRRSRGRRGDNGPPRG